VTSPHWDYVPESTAAPIPFQAWAVSNANPVKIECANDTSAHGGPAAGEASYILVANVTPSSTASLDPSGGTVYSASTTQALPAACWKYFSDYDFWQANVRLSQVVDGTKVIFSSFDKPGLECLGKEVGKARSWLGFFDKCEKRYLGSDDKIPYIVLRIDGYAEGLPATGSAARAAEAKKARSLPLPSADMQIDGAPLVQSIAAPSADVRAKIMREIAPQ
jgi:hypothetical protein